MGIKSLLFLILSTILYAHPVNLTKMDLNLSNKTLHIKFVSFNLKELNLPEHPVAKDLIKNKKNIISYTKKHIIFKNCNLIPINFKIKNEIVVEQSFKLKCPDYHKFSVDFNLFFNIDKSQEGLLNIYKNSKHKIVLFNVKKQHFDILFKNNIPFIAFLKLGIIHILTGYDHLLFLLMLIMPAMIKKLNFLDILKVITAFTLSHSITLSLSAFNVLNPPSKLIEILIAVTILLTAFNNLFHWIDSKKEWTIAFIFGFIHGFGFANALKEMSLEVKNMIKMVFGFNAGVEIGQILIILIIFYPLYILIQKYPKVYYFLIYTAIILASFWTIERIY